MRKTQQLLIASLLLLLVARSGEAALTTFLFEGRVNSVDPGIANPAFSIGAPFSALVDFDSAEDSGFVGPSFVVYPAIRSFSATVGGYSTSANAGDITVYDNFDTNLALGMIDEWEAETAPFPTGPAINGNVLWRGKIELIDTTATAFDSTELPTVLPVGGFDRADLRLDFCETATDVFCAFPLGGGQLYAEITSITAVPEPAGLHLIAAGLAITAGIAALSRQRNGAVSN